MTDNPSWARDDAGIPDPAHVRAARVISLIPDGRVRRALLRRYRMAHYRGDAVECPICGSTFSQFMWAWNAPRSICWSCGGFERHRALWLYLESEQPLAKATQVLHVAAEYPIAIRLRGQIGPGYKTSAFEPGKADLAIDITAIDLPDESLDAILCSHVLEHVDDDAQALREFRRVLKPGGKALVMVPIDHSRTTTYEDASITDPAEREKAFWQHDHVRLYAPDVADRLCAGGFEVKATRPTEMVGPEKAERYALRQDDVVFTCLRPAAGSSSSSGS